MSEKILNYGQFLTLVAKDTVIQTYGGATKNWPAENFWATVSTFRDQIDPKVIPDLMQRYGVTKLIDVPNQETIQ